MLPYRDSRITQIALAIFFVIVVVYAYFELRGILFGPHITLTSKTTEVHEPLISIKGHADRISSLSMNGKAIAVTEDGVFEEPYLLSPGLNRILLDAKDRYGHSTQQVIQVVYTPATSASTLEASSTGQVAQ